MSDFFSQATAGFLAPILPFLTDPSVSEVMVNGHDQIYVEKKGKLWPTDVRFADEDQLMAAVRRISQAVGRVIDAQHPILDGRLEDGSRVHAMIPPCARRGIYLAIRKFSQDHLTMKQLVAQGSMSLAMAKFLNLCCALSKNILVSGGTSSGKTTLLNVISTLIEDDQRIVVIEDATELQLAQAHLLPMETQAPAADGIGAVTMRDLVRASLRMRPDRIIIGEVRGGEAMDLLQAMNTGHSGSMTTLHANTPLDALSRLETLALMSDVELPWRALRSQISSAIDIVVQAARMRDGTRRITHISEVEPLGPNGEYVVSEIFRYDIRRVNPEGEIVGEHKPTGTFPTFLASAKAQGFLVDESLFKLGKGKKKRS